MLAHHVAPIRAGETLAACRALGLEERTARADGAWSERQVQHFPLSWAGRLLDRWRERHAIDTTAANLDHMMRCKAIASAHAAGVPADANDAELCEVAHQSARDLGRRVDLRAIITDKTERAEGRAWPEGVRLLALWAEALHWFERRGLHDFARLRGRLSAILARARCDHYWRRMLRKTHARAVEGTAREIGLVHRDAGCYVSDDSVRMRRGQRARNAAALESVEAVNERSQRYTLAALAAKGVSNRAIRRHELMTRIAGFDLIARECGHEAFFGTITCPSRMHRKKIAANGRAIDNPTFDGTTPDAAQRYLSKQWQRFRPAADRAGLQLYGFRIAEPNHDGTPHWHFVLFVPPLGGGVPAAALQGGRVGCADDGGEVAGAGEGDEDADPHCAAHVLLRLLRRYFLFNDSPDERGADQHRVKLEAIDPARGTATGYIAKYVAKNIDGYKVEKDLYGNDAIEASERVEAWASRWRVRQFQQIGGAPVGVWRELRRVHPERDDIAPAVAFALDAVNITARAEVDIDPAHDIARRETAAHGWATYLHLQGGHRVPRKLQRYRILREQTGEIGRYGEPVPPKPVGVECQGFRSLALRLVGWVNKMTRTAPQAVTLQVESERASWVIVSKGAAAQPDLPARGEAARPWSPVNNCTRLPLAGVVPAVERHAKLGRWRRFERRSAATDPPQTQ